MSAHVNRLQTHQQEKLSNRLSDIVLSLILPPSHPQPAMTGLALSKVCRSSQPQLSGPARHLAKEFDLHSKTSYFRMLLPGPLMILFGCIWEHWSFKAISEPSQSTAEEESERDGKTRVYSNYPSVQSESGTKGQRPKEVKHCFPGVFCSDL